MKNLNNYIFEKLKINKDSNIRKFKPEKKVKGLVLRINSGGFAGKQIADIYPCEISEIHANGKDFLVEYTNAPKNTDIYFKEVKNKDYVAEADGNLQYYDKDYCIEAIEKMRKTKKYEINGYMILKPNKFDGINDYLDILQLYLKLE